MTDPRDYTTGEAEAYARGRAEALAEVERLRAEVASLRLTLGGRTYSAHTPEPVGCPLPGACAQVAEIGRLRAIVRVNGLRAGASHADIDALLYAQPPEHERAGAPEAGADEDAVVITPEDVEAMTGVSAYHIGAPYKPHSFTRWETVFRPGCCHKTRVAGAACPVGRQCPYDALGAASGPHSHRDGGQP